jgi:hypothetical protein
MCLHANEQQHNYQAGDFGDLLASLKATHSNLQSLTGGLADASEGNHVENMVKKIFDAIDMDGRCVPWAFFFLFVFLLVLLKGNACVLTLTPIMG